MLKTYEMSEKVLTNVKSCYNFALGNRTETFPAPAFQTPINNTNVFHKTSEKLPT